jgi:hypothetical protein
VAESMNERRIGSLPVRLLDGHSAEVDTEQFA